MLDLGIKADAVNNEAAILYDEISQNDNRK